MERKQMVSPEEMKMLTPSVQGIPGKAHLLAVCLGDGGCLPQLSFFPTRGSGTSSRLDVEG